MKNKKAFDIIKCGPVSSNPSEDNSEESFGITHVITFRNRGNAIYVSAVVESRNSNSNPGWVIINNPRKEGRITQNDVISSLEFADLPYTCALEPMIKVPNVASKTSLDQLYSSKKIRSVKEISDVTEGIVHGERIHLLGNLSNPFKEEINITLEII
jgi:hypothetical protein